MSKSEKNLAEAFAGESQANRKYLAFAKKADEEGLTQVARLFRAAAAAETVHAHAHLRVLGGVGTTAANLEEAIGGETHEFMDMYPKMIEEAAEEGNKAAQNGGPCRDILFRLRRMWKHGGGSGAGQMPHMWSEQGSLHGNRLICILLVKNGPVIDRALLFLGADQNPRTKIQYPRKGHRPL
jgi:hypothetical protein